MHRSLIKVAAQSAILTASILGTAVACLAADFLETDLVANKSPLTDSNGISHTPAHVDPNLLNPWGLTASSTSPFWVSDNGAGVATLYDAAGVRDLWSCPSQHQQSRRPRLITRVRQPESCSTSLRLTGPSQFQESTK